MLDNNKRRAFSLEKAMRILFVGAFSEYCEAKMYIDVKVVEPCSPHSTGLRVNSTSNKLLPNLNWNVQPQMESVQLKLASQLSTIYADPGLDLIDSSYLVLMLM